jgi:hypothetical protein
MSTWECRGCTAAYAPGAPRCPQCGVDDPIEEAEQLEKEREQMPKITVHGGPSNVDAAPGEPGHIPDETADTVDETVEVPDPPDANAKKADWVDYAVELGHDRATVESFTKADIVELVGTRSTSANADVATGSGDASAAS